MHTEDPTAPLPSLPSGPNRERKWQRFPVELFSSVSSMGPGWDGTAINLSRQGCAIQSAAVVHLGDSLHVLIFPGANQSPIEVEVAQVRWIAGGQFGLEFLTIVPGEAIRLESLLAIIGRDEVNTQVRRA